jgi:hypothetical protein
MDILVPYFIKEDPYKFSASVAELGEDAGSITWNNALEAAKTWEAIKPTDMPELRSYFKTFGAWSSEELIGFSCLDLRALVIQLIAGDWRNYIDEPEDSDNKPASIYEDEDDPGMFYYYLGE